MGSAWNNWFHITGHTSGSWLPGDPRGWRTRHHREHIEGDYKNPPKTGSGDALLARSRALMKHEPVVLDEGSQSICAEVIFASLARHGVEVAILVVDRVHFHVLAKFLLVESQRKPTDLDPWACARNPPVAQIRQIVGTAKKDASRELSEREIAPRGPTWAKRARMQPIDDRSHQVNTYRYIERHPGILKRRDQSAPLSPHKIASD
jgi:hypothetical protein